MTSNADSSRLNFQYNPVNPNTCNNFIRSKKVNITVKILKLMSLRIGNS